MRSNAHRTATDQLKAIQNYLDELEAIREGRTHNNQETANGALLDATSEIEELHRSISSNLYFTRKGVA